MASVVTTNKRKRQKTNCDFPGSTLFILEESSPIYRLQRQKTMKTPFSGLIHIISRFRVRWDIGIMLLAIYNCFAIPYSLAFSFPSEYEVLLVAIDLIVDFLFMIDIYLNFRTSYIDGRTSEEIKDRRSIVRHYFASGRLITDILACTPIGLIDLIFQTSSSLSLIKLLKLIRVLRLSRIISQMRLTKRIKLPLRLCKLILYILIYLHLTACTWKQLIHEDQEWVSPSASITLDPYAFYQLSHTHQYLFCIYASTSLLVGIEILPVNNETYAFCIVCIMLGALLFFYILGAIAVLLFDMNKELIEFTAQIDSISDTMVKLKLRPLLQMEIIDYFNNTYHLLARNKEWENFCSIVPNTFVKEVNRALYTTIVLSQPLLGKFPSKSLLMVSKLRYRFLRPSDYLIEMEAPSDRFFLIVDGQFDVWVEGLDSLDHFVRRLGSSDYCGELGILYNQPRTATVHSISYSTVGQLTREEFLEIVDGELEQALKIKISQYKDPFRREIRKLMKKIPYLRNIEDLTLDRLLYSMKFEYFEADTIIFEEGVVSQQVYLILDGKMLVYTNLYDFELQKKLSYKRSTGTTIAKLKSIATLTRENSKRKSIRKILNPQKKAHLQMCKLGAGSILCGIQALFRGKLNVHCFTDKKTKMLILKTDDIEAAAKENIRLRIAVNNIKNQYSYYNPHIDDTIYTPPEFDCYKAFKDEFPGEKIWWKVNRRWRNAVLTIIIRNRRKVQKTFTSLHVFVQKLKAIMEAQRNNWSDLARKIEKNEISYTFINIAKFLKGEQLKNPLLRQLASFADELVKYQGESFKNANRAARGVLKLERRRKRLAIKVHELKSLFNLLLDCF